ncbi:MAG: hypothetical protein ABIE70_03995 [bacterium]
MTKGINQRSCFATGYLVTCLFLLISAGDAQAQADYYGTVRVFITEPVSRFADGLGNPYEFGFLDFALVEEIEVKEYDYYEATADWNAISAGFSSVVPTNIQAVAVVFNAEFEVRDAFPGYGYWFNAHFVDAAAPALIGVPGDNTPHGGLTHTVFLESAGSSG